MLFNYIPVPKFWCLLKSEGLSSLGAAVIIFSMSLLCLANILLFMPNKTDLGYILILLGLLTGVLTSFYVFRSSPPINLYKHKDIRLLFALATSLLFASIGFIGFSEGLLFFSIATGWFFFGLVLPNRCLKYFTILFFLPFWFHTLVSMLDVYQFLQSGVGNDGIHKVHLIKRQFLIGTELISQAHLITLLSLAFAFRMSTDIYARLLISSLIAFLLAFMFFSAIRSGWLSFLFVGCVFLFITSNEKKCEGIPTRKKRGWLSKKSTLISLFLIVCICFYGFFSYVLSDDLFWGLTKYFNSIQFAVQAYQNVSVIGPQTFDSRMCTDINETSPFLCVGDYSVFIRVALYQLFIDAMFSAPFGLESCEGTLINCALLATGREGLFDARVGDLHSILLNKMLLLGIGYFLFFAVALIIFFSIILKYAKQNGCVRLFWLTALFISFWLPRLFFETSISGPTLVATGFLILFYLGNTVKKRI